jgi:hypothetical protein
MADTTPHIHPGATYYIGDSLKLRFSASPTSLPQISQTLTSIDVKVLRIIEPTAVSVVLEVASSSEDSNARIKPLAAILKLYDRRFVPGL